MSSTDLFGLPLAAGLASDGEYTISPFAAAAVVKAMAEDGSEVYSVLFSQGMNALDLTGMARFMSIYAEKKLEKQIDQIDANTQV